MELGARGEALHGGDFFTIVHSTDASNTVTHTAAMAAPLTDKAKKLAAMAWNAFAAGNPTMAGVSGGAMPNSPSMAGETSVASTDEPATPAILETPFVSPPIGESRDSKGVLLRYCDVLKVTEAMPMVAREYSGL